MKMPWEKIFHKPLTENEGKVIIFRFVARLSYREIGKRMSLSPGRITDIEKRAIIKIRFQTRDYIDDYTDEKRF